jgi:adenine-specific DNA-methyltransferase
MDGKSLNITKEKLGQLKEILPEAFTENKIDWEKLKAALGDDIEFKNERYVLNWAGKSDAFRALQAPSTDTLVPCKEESVNFDSTGNIFIEGENLEVLKVLQKAYFGKIKMIYIDPPYNTGNDNFIYPDKFAESKEEYLGRIGDKDETGLMTREGLFRKNSKDSGHYHSNWLSMMYPRLFLARNLLRDDGVIFVSIDDNEVHNLRLLMNEVFGEENFVATFIWEKRTNRENRKTVSVRHDYVVCYCKTQSPDSKTLKQQPMSEKALSNYKNPDNDHRGLWKSDPATAQAGHGTKRQFYVLTAPNGKQHHLESGRCWLYTEDVMKEAIDDRRIWFGKDGNSVPRIKTFLDEKERGLTPESIWFAEDVSTTENSKNQLKELFEGVSVFETPKPVDLIKLAIQVSSNDAVILDFFAGSATTAHAVLALNREDGGNRKFICVQLPEKCDENSEAFKAGYKTIAEIGKERIRRVIKKIQEEQEGKLDLDGIAAKQDLGFKVFKLKESNFKIWRSNIETEEELIAQMQKHLEPLDENAKTEDVLYELLIKSGVQLTAKIKEKNGYILVNDNEIALMLEKADDKIIKQIIAAKPQKVFTLDRLFKNNDKLKTNTALQMKDAKIEFKVT